MTRMMSTVFRLGVAETACRVGVLCADSMNTCMSVFVVVLSAAPMEFSKVQVLVNKFCLFRAFYCCQILHDFHT